MSISKPNCETWPPVPAYLAEKLGFALMGSSQEHTQVVVTDASGCVIWVNPGFTALTGYSLDEMLGKKPGDVLQGEKSDPESQRQMGEAVAKGRGFDIDIVNYKKNGQPYWNNVVVIPIRSVDGEVEFFLSLQRDISRQKEAESNRKLLEACLDHATDVVIITEAEPLDLPGPRILYANKAFERHTGYTREEALGQTPRMLQSPNTDRRELDRLRRALESWESVRVELLNRKKDGTHRWIELEIAPVANEHGWYTHWISVQRDITEERKQRAELEQTLSELKRVNSLLETASRIGNIGYWRVFTDGCMPVWSNYTYEIHGIPYGTKINLDKAINSYHKAHRDMVREMVNRAIESCTGFEYEAILVRPDGKEIWVKASGEPVFGPQGGLDSLHGIIQNIDRQKRANLALEERDQRIRVLGRHVPGTLFQLRMDLNGRLSLPYLSRERYNSDQSLGQDEAFVKHHLGLIASEDYLGLKEAVRNSQEHLTPIRSEFRYQHSDRGQRWMRVSASPTREPDGSTIWHGYIEDVTDLKTIETQLRKAAERAEAANTAKSIFLSNMSHEIRTPLNAVLGMCELLQDVDLPTEAVSCVETIQAGGRALLSLIEGILDFSKIEANEVTISQGECNLRETAEAVISLLAEGARSKGLELAYSLDPELPKSCLLDGARVRQILLNLVSNAIKFTEKGHVLVHFRRYEDENKNLWLDTVVEDTGVGIPQEALDMIFQRFTQVDQGPNRAHGGAGLGLAICRRLVELMGGTVKVESIRHQGSRFAFRLPLEPVPDAEVPSSEPILANRNVIILHDNPTLGHQLVRHFVALGAHVRDIPSVACALSVLGTVRNWDLFVMDITGKEDQWFSTVRDIRSLLENQDLPVLLLANQPVSSAELTMIGRCAQISKPMKFQTLIRTTTKLLGCSGSCTGAEDPVSVETPPPYSMPVFVNLSVLVAEDNMVNWKVFDLMLRKFGIVADHVTDGLQAIEAVRKRAYDLVFMDVQMPNMDGMEAVRRIRRITLSHPQPQIIAVTANATETDQKDCLEAGMNGYMSKPVKSETIRELIVNLLGQR